MRYFITGATGLLGLALVNKLVKEKKGPIVAFVLSNDPYEKYLPPEVEIRHGDIMREKTIENALENGDLFFHLAAYISLSGAQKEMEEINVGGTKNVISACLKKKVKKLIYVSSSHVLPAINRHRIKESDYGKKGERPIGDYENTKREATDLVFHSQTLGLNISVVYPSGILSSEDPRVGEISTLIEKLKNGKLRYIVKGGYAFVDVRDVVEGLLKVSETEKSGEGYTLSGGYLSILDISKTVLEGTERKVKMVPLFFAYLGLPFIMLNEKIKGGKPLYTPVSLRTLKAPSDFDTSKAQTELGITFHDVRESIKDISKTIERD